MKSKKNNAKRFREMRTELYNLILTVWALLWTLGSFFVSLLVFAVSLAVSAIVVLAVVKLVAIFVQRL